MGSMQFIISPYIFKYDDLEKFTHNSRVSGKICSITEVFTSLDWQLIWSSLQSQPAGQTASTIIVNIYSDNTTTAKHIQTLFLLTVPLQKLPIPSMQSVSKNHITCFQGDILVKSWVYGKPVLETLKVSKDLYNNF